MNTELPSTPPPPTPPSPAAGRPRSRWLRFGLLDLVLLTLVVGAWVATEVNRRRVVRLEQRIAVMRDMAGELVVDDPTRIHVRAKDTIRYEDEAWNLYIPREGTWHLLAATRGLTADNLVEPAHRVPLPPGQYKLVLRQLTEPDQSTRFLVLADDRPLLEIVETPDWNPSRSFSSSGVSRSQVVWKTDDPLILRRSRVHEQVAKGGSRSPANDQPVNGLLLWIERSRER